MVDRAEFREGLSETRRYLLSHHAPGEYDRCYAPTVRGRRVRLCARCCGVYPGIVAGLGAAAVGPPAPTGIGLVVLLPLGALVDWTVTAFTARRGYNAVRTATGALLGYGYGLGVALLVGGDLRVLAVGVAYGVVAAALLAASRRNSG